MLQDKIKTYFDRNPQLKVLFFFDQNGDMEAEVQELNLEDVRIEFCQNDWFNLKVNFMLCPLFFSRRNKGRGKRR